MADSEEVAKALEDVAEELANNRRAIDQIRLAVAHLSDAVMQHIPHSMQAINELGATVRHLKTRVENLETVPSGAAE